MIGNSTLGGRRKSRLHREEINPLDGIVNMVDVMLIFACGLMLALILNWKVDISKAKVTDVITEENSVEVDDLQKAIKDGTLKDNYSSKGMVYEDPATGKMYIVSK